MKGIILAGGSGTRLRPMTSVVCKQLLPVYDRPMVFYPLETLLNAGIRDILLISTPRDIGAFHRLLGDGSSCGCSIRYAVQPKPEGIAQAFLIGRDFIGDDNVTLILGDNLFFGGNLSQGMVRAMARPRGATVFACRCRNPQQYGVVELDSAGKPISIQEKPERPRSDWAVTGLYFYDNQVVNIAEQLRPSKRGELEIADVNNAYLERRQLVVERLDGKWFDCGTLDSLLDAADFVRRERKGLDGAGTLASCINPSRLDSCPWIAPPNRCLRHPTY